MAVRAEISYVMVKPDGVQRGLVGDIISRCVSVRWHGLTGDSQASGTLQPPSPP
jgi:hypothetical protein